MMPLLSLIPFLLILVGIIYFTQKMRPSKRLVRLMNRKMTFVFFAAYATILFIAAVTIGIIETTSASEPGNRISDEEVARIEQPFFNGNFAAIDPSFIITKQTHRAGHVLRITNASFNHMEQLPTIYIERKSEDDGIIEETIYQPLLVVDDLDFSDRLRYVLPEWNDTEMVIHSPPPTEISYTSYRDAFLLNQFVKNRMENRGSFSSTSRQIGVHLLVPQSVQIEADDGLYIEYIES